MTKLQRFHSLKGKVFISTIVEDLMTPPNSSIGVIRCPVYEIQRKGLMLKYFPGVSFCNKGDCAEDQKKTTIHQIYLMVFSEMNRLTTKFQEVYK